MGLVHVTNIIDMYSNIVDRGHLFLFFSRIILPFTLEEVSYCVLKYLAGVTSCLPSHPF